MAGVNELCESLRYHFHAREMPVKEPFTGFYKRSPSPNMAEVESTANRCSCVVVRISEGRCGFWAENNCAGHCIAKVHSGGQVCRHLFSPRPAIGPVGQGGQEQAGICSLPLLGFLSSGMLLAVPLGSDCGTLFSIFSPRYHHTCFFLSPQDTHSCSVARSLLTLGRRMGGAPFAVHGVPASPRSPL